MRSCRCLQVKPILSYVVLALNLAVYAVGIGIALTAGGEASNDYFLQLAKVNEDVLNGQYWRCGAVLLRFAMYPRACIRPVGGART